jgi:hypothetical protein
MEYLYATSTPGGDETQARTLMTVASTRAITEIRNAFRSWWAVLGLNQ